MRSHIRFCLFCFSLSVLVLGDAHGATYYVDGNTGNDTSNGVSWASARATISAGDDLLGAGDTLAVRGDCVYRESVSVPVSGTGWDAMVTYQGVPGTNSGTMPIVTTGIDLDEAAYVQVAAYPNVYSNAFASTIYRVHEKIGWDSWREYSDKVNVSDCNDAQASKYLDTDNDVLYIHTSDSTPPSNFTLEAAPGDAPFYVNDAYVKIAGFRCRHTLNDGISVNGAQYVEVCDNVCHANNRAGIGLNSSSLGCRIHDNICTTNGTGIRCLGGVSNELYGNTLYFNEHAFSTSDQSGDPCTDYQIYGNTVCSNADAYGYGQQMYDLVRGKIYNNTFFNNEGIALFFRNDCISPVVYNNTFYGNKSSTIRCYTSVADVTTNLTVFNNIIWPSAGNAGISLHQNCTNGMKSDYNLIYSPDGNAGHWAGVDQATLADWQGATGWDLHSIEAKPMLVSTNVGAEDFHIAAGSPAINAGTDAFQGYSAPGMDIDGERRPRRLLWDLGSDEIDLPEGTLFLIR